MKKTKTVALAAMVALSGLSASAGGLTAPAMETVVPAPPPVPGRMGSLNGVLPVAGALALLLLLSQTGQSSSGTP